MKESVTWFDAAPLWVKIFCALPIFNLTWALYRLIKGAAYGKTGLIIVGIIWILFGWAALWIFDLVAICVRKHPLFA